MVRKSGAAGLTASARSQHLQIGTLFELGGRTRCSGVGEQVPCNIRLKLTRPDDGIPMSLKVTVTLAGACWREVEKLFPFIPISLLIPVTA